MSNPTHYSGPELGALLAQVREELGEEATILEANKVRSGGIAGFFAKESFEISASTEVADILIDDDRTIDDGRTFGDGMDHDGRTFGDDLEQDDSTLRHDIMIHDEPVVHDDRMIHDELVGHNDSALSEPDDLRYQTESATTEVLEPLDVIGDLAGTTLPTKRRATMPIETPQSGSALATDRPAPPARIADEPTPERPALIFNFENLGPSAIPTRLQPTEPASSREPIPTPSPLRSQLESSSVPSTTVGERVADALMERAELVNALEHLDKTDELIAAQFDESPQSIGTLSDSALSDASFEQILQRTLTAPYAEEVEETETLTTAEAVAQRIASQNLPDDTPTEPAGIAELELETERVEAVPVQTSRNATPDPETASVETVEIEAVQVAQGPDNESIQALVGQADTDLQPLALTSRAPIPIEQGATREHPDFWTRMNLAQEEIALYQLGRSNVTAIVGPLDLALPVARQCQQDDWIGVEDMAILSSRPSIPGAPSWQAVNKVDDLYWAMNEWCANQRRGLVVVDTADLSSSQLLRHITQLRANGADMVRLAIPSGLDVADFVSLSNEIGGKLAVDLPLGTDPSSILGALDEGLTIGSVGGRPLTPELLVALRIEVSRSEAVHSEVAGNDLSGNQVTGY